MTIVVTVPDPTDGTHTACRLVAALEQAARKHHPDADVTVAHRMPSAGRG